MASWEDILKMFVILFGFLLLLGLLLGGGGSTTKDQN